MKKKKKVSYVCKHLKSQSVLLRCVISTFYSLKKCPQEDRQEVFPLKILVSICTINVEFEQIMIREK